jgi:tRNA(Arg) A34 adenosine deaminase TadA
VVYDPRTGEVIGQGANARERDRDPSAHAETIAILRRAGHAATGD